MIAQDLQNALAPSFTASASGGKTISLSDYKGRKLILYFYPKDMTPGCTTQIQDFTRLYPEFTALNCEILGVSKDSPTQHDKFIAKHQAPFSLISDDEDARICENYGVWQKKKFMGKEYMGIVRSTFLIDEQGYIKHIWSPVKVKGHAENLVEYIKNP